jgi:hypothetical protein
VREKKKGMWEEKYKTKNVASINNELELNKSETKIEQRREDKTKRRKEKRKINMGGNK